MTICGFTATGPQGLAWADTEVYLGNHPTAREARKLAVSTGGVVGVGTGWASVIENFAAAVAELGDARVTESVAALRGLLISETNAKRAAVAANGWPYDICTRAGVIAFDGARLRGFCLFEEEEFTPREVDAWASPTVQSYPTKAVDVIRTADDQMRRVRAKIPSASGLNLTIAKIGPIGVAVTKAPMPRARAA